MSQRKTFPSCKNAFVRFTHFIQNAFDFHGCWVEAYLENTVIQIKSFVSYLRPESCAGIYWVINYLLLI